ncbi:MAG: hypothetical protein M4579_004051 [Chaenotheca gracillima]|nr:MAG: hypothetical protein M4579_004051 [Chaenotheca gracillima]
MNKDAEEYSDWSRERLVDRVQELERQLRQSNTRYHPSTSPRAPFKRNTRADRQFDPSRYSTRHIALKLAYLGQRYNGFEHHINNKTSRPTIEEELFKALAKARLIFPRDGHETASGMVDWDGSDYSKCGRTDKGVSAFGQVIGLRVRSNRPLARKGDKAIAEGQIERPPKGERDVDDAATDVEGEESPFDPIKDELPYPIILNHLLPEDIRILAWCPSPPEGFSARFSCRERRYKYFFSQPAFAPLPGTAGLSSSQRENGELRTGYLNIEAMREGASRFVGLHDFRNFCKIDPSKQITNFERRVFHATVDEVEPSRAPVSYVGNQGLRATGLEDLQTTDHSSGSDPALKMYTFTLHGSAFLWHQVRHMVAILFLIGQGLESPSLISQLLDVKLNPTKPMYEMASDAALVLCDCIFPKEDDEARRDALDWVFVGENSGAEKTTSKWSDGKFGPGGVVDDLWRAWRKRKIDEVLAGSLLDLAAEQGEKLSASAAGSYIVREHSGKVSQRVFAGGDGPRLAGKYVPVLKKPKMETPETVNKRYAQRKNFEMDGQRRQAGFKSVQLDQDTVSGPS